MSRYIDADALKAKYTMVTKRYSGGIMERPAVLLEAIDEAPSIDIVRCKDCRWGFESKDKRYIYCVFYRNDKAHEMFCSAGEERAEQTEPRFKVDEIGDDDPTIHAIAYLQKVGWLQEHDRALTEQTEPQPCEWCKFYDGENCFSQEPCKVMLYFKTEPQQVTGKLQASEDEPQTDCTEALTLLWIHKFVTDDEFYRIDARLKQTEPKQGVWIERDGYRACSECGWLTAYKHLNYCPNCGERMVEDEQMD